MRGEKPESTATQRLGHVLGWLGNSLGGLLVVGSLGFMLYAAEPYLPVERSNLVAEARSYAKQILELTPKGRDDLSIYDDETARQVQILGGKLEAAAGEIDAIDNKRNRAKTDMLFVGMIAFVPGVLIMLFGQGLRYIFAGPRR